MLEGFNNYSGEMSKIDSHKYDCSKCYHRFECRNKNKKGYYCESYFNSWEHDKQVRADAVEECIKVMKYCWYNGQQPLDVLVRRLEELKENK